MERRLNGPSRTKVCLRQSEIRCSKTTEKSMVVFPPSLSTDAVRFRAHRIPKYSIKCLIRCCFSEDT